MRSNDISAKSLSRPMPNKYLAHVKSAGVISGIRKGWNDASPAQRLVIGIGGTGGAMSAVNLANSTANTIEAKKKTSLDEKSLRALQSINKKLDAVQPATTMATANDKKK